MALRDWKARHLLGVWSAYWVTLLVAVTVPAARVVAPLLRDPLSHGRVSMSYGNGALAFTASRAGAEVWTGSVSLLAAALWIALPPLALWAVWLARRPRRAATEPSRDTRENELPWVAEHAPGAHPPTTIQVPRAEEGHAPPTDARR